MKGTRFAMSWAIGGIALCATPAEAQTILPGIIHQWSADGDATDSVGGADGSMTGAVSFAEGVFGEAFDFVDGQVDFGNQAGNFGTSNFTISLWLRTEAACAKQGVFEKRGACISSAFWEVRFWALTCSLPVVVRGDLWQVTPEISATAQTSPGFDDGKWHHYALRRDGLELSAFVDGIFEDTASSTQTINMDNNAPLVAGKSVCENTDGTAPFLGQLDEIQLYGRALDDSEIAMLAEGLPAPCPADLDGDGEVRVPDLIMLLAAWGSCTE